MNIKIEKASGNDITLVVAPQANQKIIIDRNIKGNTGDAGAGVAVGGTTGQILSKLSNANYDAGWINNANGTVTSVIGTGTVNGLSLSGAVTSSGDLTLGGTLSGIANNQLTNSSISINGTAVALGGTVTTPQGTVTSVTATSPVTSTGGATPVIAIPAATTSVDGYLTSTDWDTFNSKLSAQVYPSAGIPNSTGTAWGTSYSTTGTGDVVLSNSPTITGSAILPASTFNSSASFLGQSTSAISHNLQIGSGNVDNASNIIIGDSDLENSYRTTTTFLGDVRFNDANNQPIFVNATFNGTISTNAMLLTGDATISSGATSVVSIGRSQTTGTTTIGGTSTTGAITIGRSTGNQTVNIATGINVLGNKAINLGTGATNGVTTITIGATGIVNGATTINIGTQARSSNATSVNIATNATGGNAEVNIGSAISGSTTTIRSNSTVTKNLTVNGILIQQTTTVETLIFSPATGTRSFVTNALAPSFGATVVGGGTVGVPVYYDGTSWKVG